VLANEVLDLTNRKNNVSKELATRRHQADNELNSAQSKASLVTKVPCRTYAGLPEQCVLLSDAIENGRLITQLEARCHELALPTHPLSVELAELSKRVETSEATLKDLKCQCPSSNDVDALRAFKNDLGYAATLKDEINRRISDFENEKWELRQKEADKALVLLKEKESQMKGLENQATLTMEKYRRLLEDVDEEILAFQQAIEDFESIAKIENDEQECLKRLADLQRQIANDRGKVLEACGGLGILEAMRK